jgi:hypothetical protein
LFLQALNAPVDHKAQAISTGWKNRRIKRELSEFKAQKHLFGRGTAQYANTKTKTQHPTKCYRFSPKHFFLLGNKTTTFACQPVTYKVNLLKTPADHNGSRILNKFIRFVYCLCP